MADITIYNHWKDPVTGYDNWQRTIINGASFSGSHASTATSAGQKSADKYTLRIPIDAVIENRRTYLAPKAWEAVADRYKHWTIQTGDKVVNLATTLAVSRSHELEEKFDQVATVLGWADNRRGVLATQHWRIEGA